MVKQTESISTATREPEHRRTDHQERGIFCCAAQIRPEGGQQVEGGTYNLERGLFFLYSLYVVYSYTDQKFKTDRNQSDKVKVISRNI